MVVCDPVCVYASIGYISDIFYNHWLNISVSAQGYNFPKALDTWPASGSGRAGLGRHTVVMFWDHEYPLEGAIFPGSRSHQGYWALGGVNTVNRAQLWGE